MADCCGKSECCCKKPPGALGGVVIGTLSLSLTLTVICLLCYIAPVVTITWETEKNCWDECHHECVRYNYEYDYCEEYEPRRRAPTSVTWAPAQSREQPTQLGAHSP